jgi:hypothetical protein
MAKKGLESPIAEPVVLAPVIEQATQDDLNEWWRMSQELDKLKAEEMQLRKKIFATYFRAPVEGTNTVPLSAGWVLKAAYPITRKVDVPLLTNLGLELAKQGLPMDSLIKYKPELSVTDYRKLSDEQRKLLDQVLDIKPGSPQVEIVLPKR